jgi:hypothetical protein
MTNAQFAVYMAGVTDSDGSLSIAIRRPKNSSPEYTIMFGLTWVKNNSSIAIMDRLKEIYGGSWCCIKTQWPTQFPNARPYVKYCLVSKQCEKFLRDIVPFLQIKRKQGRNMLRMRKVVSNYYSVGHPKPQRVKDFQAAVYELNKRLNASNKAEKCV